MSELTIHQAPHQPTLEETPETINNPEVSAGEPEPPPPVTGNTAKRRKDCRQCELWNHQKERIRVMELLESAISKLEDRLQAKDFKPTVGDYLKLIQLEKDYEQEHVEEIKVTWVDSQPSKDK